MKLIDEEVDFTKLQYTKYKKPYFENANAQFNISHSGSIVVVIISTDVNTEIGIDIEEMNAISVDDFKPQMTPYEHQAIIHSEDEQKAFFSYWTQKEAVIKAHGKGLSIPLKSFEIKNNQTYIDGIPFFLSEMNIKDGYVCHVATQEKIDTQQLIIKEININRFTTP